MMREALVVAARELAASGLNAGSAGNLSVRVADGMLITPSGVAPAALSAASMAHVDHAGCASGPLQPSTEWRFHHAIYAARPEAGAVVHTHSPFATALACQHRDIPAFHYMVARFGGADVRCAPYATFGTPELSAAVTTALIDRTACLMANHGMTVFAADLPKALAAAHELEVLCEHYLRTLQLGPPILLDEAEMARVLEKFRTYGRPQAAE